MRLVCFGAATIIALGCTSSNETPGTPGDAGADAGQLAPDPFVDELGKAERALWIGAHPDDEFATAALLGELGAERRVELAFLIATHGEKTTICERPDGCAPDMASVREIEMADSAAALQGSPAKVVQLGLPDAAAGWEATTDPRETLHAWAEHAGGYEALVEKFRSVIEEVNPGIVLFLDPRNGGTCHPDHRAVGHLVVAALDALGNRAPAGYLVNSAGRLESGKMGFAAPVEGDPELLEYDATRFGPAAGGETWHYTLAVMRAHVSQFPERLVTWAENATPEMRRHHYLRLGSGWPAEGPYDLWCPVKFGHGPFEADNTGGP